MVRLLRGAALSSRVSGRPSMKIVAGNSNQSLAKAIAGYLDLELAQAAVKRFADDEIFVEIQENVRGEDVFVVQSTSFPANDNLMELLIIIDALRRASARRITAVIPISAMRDRTANRSPARRSRPSSSPT
jgi:ribose-phosphate pyrophosphokinase